MHTDMYICVCDINMHMHSVFSRYLSHSRYRMTYLFFNGTKPNFGYEVALAVSDDLLNWQFNPPVGDDNGIVFRYTFV